MNLKKEIETKSFVLNQLKDQNILEYVIQPLIKQEDAIRIAEEHIAKLRQTIKKLKKRISVLEEYEE